jgi:nicotinamidase/pyrazinamidase
MSREQNIPLADAKVELRRIDKILAKPHLLIGGLAVQQYVIARNSSDIDLVCDFAIAQAIIRQLYPLKLWNVQDRNHDEYRPSIIISPLAPKEGLGDIHFGPKILQRLPYNHIDWDEIGVDAQPFKFQQDHLPNILVPRAEALAFTKLLSFIGRDKRFEEKRLQDLQDFVDLTNINGFELKRLYGFMYKAEVNFAIRRDFVIENDEQERIIADSILYSIYNDLLDRPNRKDRGSHKTGPHQERAGVEESPASGPPVLVTEIAEITERYEGKNLLNSQQERDILIVVDVQNDFLPGGLLPTPDTETLVPPLNRLVQKAKEAGAEIVFTRDWHPEDHYSFLKWPKHCVKGSRGAAFPEALEIPDGAHIIDIGSRNDADGYSPFADPALQSLVTDPRIRTIYICGIALEFCVLATCRDAVWYGKTVIALEPYIRADQKNRNDVEFFWQIIGSLGVIRAKNAPFN